MPRSRQRCQNTTRTPSCRLNGTGQRLARLADSPNPTFASCSGKHSAALGSEGPLVNTSSGGIFIHSNETGSNSRRLRQKFRLHPRQFERIALLLVHCGNSLQATKEELRNPRRSSLVIRVASAQDKIINNDPARNRKRRGTMITTTRWRNGFAAGGVTLTHQNTHWYPGTDAEISSLSSGQAFLNRNAGGEPALTLRD